MDSKHLLIAGNDTEYCELLKDRLKEDKVSVATIDLASCLSEICSKNPDVLLMDAQGNEAGKSLELLKQLRSYRDDNESLQETIQNLPVVVLTDKTSEILSLFEEIKNTSCIEKPYDPSDLGAKISSILK